MVPKIVDASALAALLFGEPEAEAVAGRLAGARLIAPALLSFELTNVCLIKCRRHPDQKLSLMAAFRLRDRLGVEEVAIDHGASWTLHARPASQPTTLATFGLHGSSRRSW
jgi:uncharacterized protein with PIN domain